MGVWVRRAAAQPRISFIDCAFGTHILKHGHAAYAAQSLVGNVSLCLRHGHLARLYQLLHLPDFASDKFHRDRSAADDAETEPREVKLLSYRSRAPMTAWNLRTYQTRERALRPSRAVTFGSICDPL